MVPHLFLDIDGVLNAHEQHSTGYSGIRADKAAILNSILTRVPDLQIVISSAWRYLILQGDMTVRGFEIMLMVHGVECYQRVAGHTEADGPLCEEPDHGDKETWHRNGITMRAAQIKRYAEQHGIRRWVAIDDLPLELPKPHFVRTDGKIGMTQPEADTAVAVLQNCWTWTEPTSDTERTP
jgi:hypothetical protein